VTSIAARKVGSILSDMAKYLEELFGKIERLPPAERKAYPEVVEATKLLVEINGILKACAQKGAISRVQERQIASRVRAIAAAVEKGARTRR
jgi:hypothetical protein